MFAGYQCTAHQAKWEKQHVVCKLKGLRSSLTVETTAVFVCICGDHGCGDFTVWCLQNYCHRKNRQIRSLQINSEKHITSGSQYFLDIRSSQFPSFPCVRNKPVWKTTHCLQVKRSVKQLERSKPSFNTLIEVPVNLQTTNKTIL